MTKDEVLKFQGYMPYPPLDKVDDWGLSVEQQARASIYTPQYSQGVLDLGTHALNHAAASACRPAQSSSTGFALCREPVSDTDLLRGSP